jgi:acyl-CoA reductase-like NAD-dependent aldehyde dehydrogenase
MKAAAEHFAGITLETGGKNPAIVDSSAAIGNAARKIAWGRVANAGQTCVAPDYVLAHESVFETVVAELVQSIGSMYNPAGQGFEHSPELLRIVNDEHFARVERLLADARAKGAHIACGGETRDAAAGLETLGCEIVRMAIFTVFAARHERSFSRDRGRGTAQARPSAQQEVRRGDYQCHHETAER